MLKLTTPIYELHLHDIPRVAFKTAQKLAEGIAGAIGAVDPRAVTVGDLLHYLPMRYEDRSNLLAIRDLQHGVFGTISVEVRVSGSYAVKGGKLRIFEFSAVDGTGQIRAFWWNQTYLVNTFTKGRRVLLYGQWKRGKRGFFEVENPDYELVAGEEDDVETIHTGRSVPVYRRLGDIRAKQLRSIVYNVLQRVDLSSVTEVLPADI
ncbi:MAG: OB-fold nucleic acid binding domain-containing protein, partial [Blastocatellia bacterium]